MGILQRWKTANQYAKFGKELVQNSTTLTGTRREKGVVQHIGELIAEMEHAISTANSACDAPMRQFIARNIHNLVLQAPRGAQGHKRLYVMNLQCRSSKTPRHIAPWIASLLVLADHVCARARGDGLAGYPYVTMMQGRIEEFLESNGIRAWGVPIVNESEFEKLRTSSGHASA